MAEQPAKPRMFNIEDYKTAQRAQDAIKMFLVLPDGTRTDDYLMVVGTESTEFRGAKYVQEQRALEISRLKTVEERMAAVEDARVSVLAACVKGWSFNVEFSEAAAKELLAGAPYLADSVDTFISRRANFFAKPSTDSSRTRKAKRS